VSISVYMKGYYEEKTAVLAQKNKANSKPNKANLYSHGTGFYRIGGVWNRATLAIVGQRRESKILIRTFSAVMSGNRQILL